jgi:peptidoglycan hydrolase-like protein with peptidoglycan-binding domain
LLTVCHEEAVPATTLTALQRKTLIALLGAAVFLFSVASHAASATEKKPLPKLAVAKKPAAKSTTAKKSAVKSRSAPTWRKSSYNPRRTRPQPFRYRLARLKLQPERISEIQGALARAGYFSQEPNGKWDDPTRTAMLRFQQDHGFPGTGLPEAKSLMKLGLGPHPLPDELDSTAQAGAPPPHQPESGSPTPQQQ